MQLYKIIIFNVANAILDEIESLTYEMSWPPHPSHLTSNNLKLILLPQQSFAQ